MSTILVPRQREGEVRQDGTKVQLLLEGRLMMELSYESAQALAKALWGVSKKAEELAKVEQVIHDQAILMRSGLMLPLVSNKTMAVEAAKEAQWNSDLRRYIPQNNNHGIVYAPRVYHEPSKEE